MNKPINVLRDNLPGVANVTYDLGKAQGKEEGLIVEYSKHYDNAYSKLEENATMEITTKTYIVLKDKEGNFYRIDPENGEPLIEMGQDVHKVMDYVKEFKEAIKEIGLKLFNEMLEERKYINLGRDNEIDTEQVKLAVKEYLAEKEEQEAEI